MVTFTLTSQTISLSDGGYNVMVMPNEEIHHYIHSYVYTDDPNPTFISYFITEQTPLLFNKFQSMENIPLEIRQNYTL